MRNSAGDETERKAGKYAWYVCFVMMFTLLFSYMDRTVLALIVIPIEHDFGINDSTIGLLQGAAYSIFYVAFAFPLSRLSDSGNRKRLIMIGLVVWCTATIGFGLARTVAQLFFARIIVAIGEAVLMPAAVSILADYFPPRLRGRALSIFSIGTFLGAGLGLGGGGVLLKHLGSSDYALPGFGLLAPWRLVLVIIGLAGFVLIPLLLAVREPVRLEDTGAAAGQPMPLADVLKEFNLKRFAILSCAFGFAALSLGGTTVNSWGPTLLVRIHHVAQGSAGLLIGGLTLVLGPLGALTGGSLADYFRGRGHFDNKMLVGLLAGLGCIIGSVLFTLPSYRVATFGVVVVSYLVAFNFGNVQGALAELVSSRMRGFTTAIFLLFTNLLQATVGPLAVGLLNNHVFHDPNAIGLSMRIVVPSAFALAAVSLALGRRPFRSVVGAIQNARLAAPPRPAV